METKRAKSAAGESGMVATSAAAASEIGAGVLAAGGNAVDAAVAAGLALTVADPANVSLLGRCHAIVAGPGGAALAIDGATEAPAGIAPAAAYPVTGHGAVPVPGLLAGLHTAWRLRGRLPWAELALPAARLAEAGFAVTEGLARLWAEAAPALAADQPATRLYLKPNGAPYASGEIYRNPVLGDFLHRVAEDGSDALYRDAAEAIAAESAASGGHLTAPDLRAYRALPGEIVRLPYAACEVVTVGRQAWGHTLALMLGIVDAWRRRDGATGAVPFEIVALAIHRALADQPQQIGTLQPRADGIADEDMLDRAFQRQRAGLIVDRLAAGPAALAGYLAQAPQWPAPKTGDTTHLSVIDRDGLAVAVTTSIGPGFGARMASETTGALFGHSYRMASGPAPGARDRTEMTPAIVLRDGQPILAVGAADNERIPGATAQVISHVLDGGLTVAEAIAAPRVNWGAGRLRTSAWMPADERRRLGELGLPLAPAAGETLRTGVVHAVGLDPQSGRYMGAADPNYEGTAAGPEHGVSFRAGSKSEN